MPDAFQYSINLNYVVIGKFSRKGHTTCQILKPRQMKLLVLESSILSLTIFQNQNPHQGLIWLNLNHKHYLFQDDIQHVEGSFILTIGDWNIASEEDFSGQGKVSNF